MSDAHNCPCAEACMLQRALNTMGGKWKLPILCLLPGDRGQPLTRGARNSALISRISFFPSM